MNAEGKASPLADALEAKDDRPKLSIADRRMWSNSNYSQSRVIDTVPRASFGEERSLRDTLPVSKCIVKITQGNDVDAHFKDDRFYVVLTCSPWLISKMHAAYGSTPSPIEMLCSPHHVLPSQARISKKKCISPLFSAARRGGGGMQSLSKK
ncbi:hypothetical protein Y032_0220g2533 [Ancylostoma ceylanicum]|uniref:Uncharacterized protein n=1 Tax=Ancylostoma ceylanicum TaxID=53326 RepID=A0A016SIB8_9BILA|nr:hypothetical protein Y032_0220g2533 [Ancylostoma ceylanicum]